jgi:hypothetical protein
MLVTLIGLVISKEGASGGAGGRGIASQDKNSRVRFLMGSLEFLGWLNYSVRMQ